MQSAFNWRVHLPRFRDPGRAGFRRAIRAAILAPALFFTCSALLADPQLVTFATFGVFALGVIGDFGGTTRPRATAYALTTAVGCVLISVGTLASGIPILAAMSVLVAGFVLQFAGVFGGYVTAAQPALTLSFVLAAAVPASADLLPQRLAGWVIGGALALVGGVWLWPRHEQATLQRVAADACDALAELVAARFARTAADDEIARLGQAAHTSVEALRQLYLQTPWRPASSARQDRAFAQLIDEVARQMRVVSSFPKVLPAARVEGAPAVAEAALAQTSARVLHDSAAVLRGGERPPDLGALVDKREQQRDVFDDWAAERLRDGDDVTHVLQGLEAARAPRVASYVTLALGAAATLAAGFDIHVASVALPPEVDAGGGNRSVLRRAALTLTTHLRPTSIWWRNSLRASAGLGLAVLLVEIIGLEHAFWAVLGTLAVLRSSAVATGRTALAAVAGTTLGIVPISLLLIPLGANEALLRALLPVAVFLAAYTPAVIGFAVGQAAFTLLVVVLFNLLQPVGWTLGLVRLEDILVGAAVSLVVGALFWPRGARGQLSSALGGLYRRDATYLRAVLRYIVGIGSRGECVAARQVAVSEAARTGEVFDQFVHDRASKVLPMDTWAALQAGGSHLLLAGDSLERMASRGTRVTACQVGADVLSDTFEELVQELTRLGEQLEQRQQIGSSTLTSSVAEALPERQLWDASLACLRQWGGADDQQLRTSALGTVTASDWLRYLADVMEHLNGPAAAVVRVANLRWWQ